MNSEILVVEDNLDNLKLVRWILEDEGHTVTHASTAEIALEICESTSFDLVLMDIGLPGMDGKQATRLLRQRPAFRDSPILALTAHAISAEQSIILDSGVDDIITKPIDETAFLETINRYLESISIHGR